MNIFIILSIFISFTSSAYAADLDALSLLKRDLEDSIEVISPTEVRYCPDNTCEIYKTKKSNNNFSKFIYLHLFHEADYIYLNESFGEQKAFRQIAKEEPIIRKSAEGYCPDNPKTPKCILDNMRKQLDISLCFGRYDEGQFCTVCNEETKCE